MVIDILTNWRNLYLADNIAELFCTAASSGKDLDIAIGQKHEPGLKSRLQKMAGDTKLRFTN